MLRVFGLGFTTAASLVVVAGFGAVVAVEAAGVVTGLVVGGATVPGVAVEPAAVELPGTGVLDVVGVTAGSVVNGVGSGGNGLAITPAIRSVRPASDPLLRYLYQVVSVSIQAVFLDAYAASLPESATARA